MDYPEICDKHKFNDATARINHTTNTNTVGYLMFKFFLPLQLSFSQNNGEQNKRIQRLNSSEFSLPRNRTLQGRD